MLDVLGRNEHLSVSSSVFSAVLQSNSYELLLDRARRLVGCENALAWGADLVGCLDELLGEVLCLH